MGKGIEPIENLAHQLSRLPGIGRKTAHRLAYHILSMSADEVAQMADAMTDAKKLVRFCGVCGHYAVEDLCAICADPQRTSDTLCVVRDPRDVLALERTNDYRGRYHVLHGVLSPMDGVGPDDIRIKELLARLPREGVKELILATNPDVEGEATASYIARLVKAEGLAVTRIAHGIPIGGNLEYIDELTLQRALSGRRSME